MSRNIFGWDYPAGAANDPNAPYNQDVERCLKCEEEASCNDDGLCEECAEKLKEKKEED